MSKDFSKSPSPPSEKETMPIDRKSGRYGPVLAILVTLLAYFGSQIFGGLILGSVAGILGYDEAQIKTAFETSVIWQFSFLVLAGLMMLLIVGWFVRLRRIRLADIGLGRRPRLKDAGYSLIAFVIYFALIAAVLALVSAFVPAINLDQKQQLGFEPASSQGPLALIFLGLVIIPAIAEEIVVRGFLYTGLRSAMPFFAAAISASLIFGIAHLQLGSGAPPLWVVAIDTFVLSMVLIKLRERTGALWSGMLVHGAKNTLAFVSLFILHLS